MTIQDGRLVIAGTLAILLTLAMPPVAAGSSTSQPQPVSEALMQQVIETIAERGYATGTTTNQARFVADFLLALARNPEVGQRGPFWIDPDDFLSAWIRATDTPTSETPSAIENVARFEQRFYVDPTPSGIDVQTRNGESPKTALAVCVAWPDALGRPNSYEYLDTMSDPEVRMRHEQKIRYLLLDTGEKIAYEHIRGVAGQPVSGGLGTLFSLLGMARIHSTRLAIAEDGTQVNFTKGRKLFGFKTLATIQPDGKAHRGVPDDRPDLVELKSNLEEAFNVSFEGDFPSPCD